MRYDILARRSTVMLPLKSSAVSYNSSFGAMHRRSKTTGFDFATQQCGEQLKRVTPSLSAHPEADRASPLECGRAFHQRS